MRGSENWDAAMGDQILSARRSGTLAHGLPPKSASIRASRRVTHERSGDPCEHQCVLLFRTQTADRPVCMSFPVLLAAAGQSRQKPNFSGTLARMGGLQALLLRAVSLAFLPMIAVLSRQD